MGKAKEKLPALVASQNGNQILLNYALSNL